MVPVTQFIDVDRFFNLLSKSSDDITNGGLVAKSKVLARATIELPQTISLAKTPDSLDIKIY